MSVAHPRVAAPIPAAGRWPLLERIPRRRFLRFRRNGRITAAAGSLVIAGLIAAFFELDTALPHLLGAGCIGLWVLAATWVAKQRWLRWLRDEFAGEVNAKMDAIRRAAPLN